MTELTDTEFKFVQDVLKRVNTDRVRHNKNAIDGNTAINFVRGKKQQYEKRIGSLRGWDIQASIDIASEIDRGLNQSEVTEGLFTPEETEGDVMGRTKEEKEEIDAINRVRWIKEGVEGIIKTPYRNLLYPLVSLIDPKSVPEEVHEQIKDERDRFMSENEKYKTQINQGIKTQVNEAVSQNKTLSKEEIDAIIKAVSEPIIAKMKVLQDNFIKQQEQILRNWQEQQTKSAQQQERESLKKEQMLKTNYYDILGVPNDANKEQITRSYKRLIGIFHPDTNVSDPDLNTIMSKINQAYETLKDDQKRHEYDTKLKAEQGAGYQKREERQEYREKYEYRQQDILSGVEGFTCQDCGNTDSFPAILFDLFDYFMSYRPTPYGELGKIPYKNFFIYCHNCLIKRYPIYQKELSHVSSFVSPIGIVLYYIDEPSCAGYEQLESFCAFRRILTSDFKKLLIKFKKHG